MNKMCFSVDDQVSHANSEQCVCDKTLHFGAKDYYNWNT